MDKARSSKDITALQGLAIAGFALVGLFFLGFFDPLPERREATANGVFVYFGPEGETIPRPGAVPAEREAALAALEASDYFGAYAAGPRGRHGVWTGAWTPELARTYALAACGVDCRIVAERHPLHRDPERTEPVATTAMARNLAIHWPFHDEHIAIGGAGAWGHRTEPAGKGAWKNAMRDAAADCETRRAAERAPNTDISPPCTVQRLTEIVDLRPKPALYPARFTVGLTALTPVAETEVVEMPGAPSRWITPYMPKGLHGARADNGETSYDVVRNAGWPAAGAQIALTKCNAARRPGEPDCVVSHVRIPENDVPSDRLAVTPGVYEAYQVWLARDGAGAFAIGPYGAGGPGFDHPSVEAAMQKAAEDAGLVFVFNPVVATALSHTSIDEQADALAASDGPVVAYCASGMRSSLLWSLAVAGQMPTEEILDRTRAAGYPLDHLHGQIDGVRARRSGQE